jgi:4-oxalocrotonate tautomerase
MPRINVQIIEGIFDDAQKAEIVRCLSEAMVGIKGDNLHPVTWVVIEEVKSGGWASAGRR